MSERDQELIGRLTSAYEAFNRSDFDAAVTIAHPDLEFVRPGGQSTEKGAGALRSWMEPDAFVSQVVEPTELRVHGDKVLVRQKARAQGAGSGIEMEVESWAVWTFDDDGQATRLAIFLPHEGAQALAAAGLAE